VEDMCYAIRQRRAVVYYYEACHGGLVCSSRTSEHVLLLFSTYFKAVREPGLPVREEGEQLCDRSCSNKHTHTGSAVIAIMMRYEELLFVTAVPIIKLFAWGEGGSGTVGDVCYVRRRAEACVD
jgi:hypothetical protein